MPMRFLRQNGACGLRFFAYLSILCCLSLTAASHAQGLPANGTVGDIYTYAGAGLQGYGPTMLVYPEGVTFDKSGNLYVCDASSSGVKKIDVYGTVSDYAPNIGCTALAFDGAGNLYAIAGLCTIVKITPAIVVTVFMGGYNSCYSVSPGTASSSTIGEARGLAFDTVGNLYISTVPEVSGQLPGYILKVSAGAGGLTGNSPVMIVAGTATAGYNGDNQPATQAELNSPAGIALDASGNIYIADTLNFRVRMISAAGQISTIAGNGILGHTNGSVGLVQGVQWDATSGNVYVSDIGEQVIYKITARGTTTVYAGTAMGAGTPSNPNLNCQNYYVSDGVPATAAPLSCPYGIAVDGLGNVYIADTLASRVRVVIAPPIAPCSVAGNICTIAGNGMAAFGGDGGPATAASLNNPLGLYVDGSQNIYVADSANNRVRKFTVGSNIQTFAGNGNGGPQVVDSGDGQPAPQATLNYPVAVTEDASSNIAIADQFANGNLTPPVGDSDTYGDIRLVSPAGIISSVIITTPSTCPACVQTYSPYLTGFLKDLAFGYNTNTSFGTPGAAYYGAFYGGSVDFVSGIDWSFGGADALIGPGPAASVVALAIDSSGNIYFSSGPDADYLYNPNSGTNTVSMIDTNGNLTRIIGSGASSYSGDGYPAINAGLSPGSLALDSQGNLYVVDLSVNAIRVVLATNGVITPQSPIYTIVGSPSLPAGFSGDGGPATSAQLNAPGGIKVDAAGNLYISDSANNRVRMVVNPAAGSAWPGAIGILPGSGCTPIPGHLWCPGE